MTESNRQARRKWLVPLLIALLLATAALLAGAHILSLDRIVRKRLAGRIWALPAEVYARPLELYPNLPLNPQTLADELELSGYRLEERPSAAGSYSRNGGSFEIVTRDFPYPSGRERSEHFTLVVAAGRVTALHRTGTGEAITLVRIDPARIGGFHALEYEDRLLLARSELPDLLVSTLLAVEDRDFYSHAGIAPKSIVRALFANLRAKAAVQGASTLTQQLARNFFLSSDKTLARKLDEAIIAVLLELHYDKETILTAYANEIFLGQDGDRAIHGMGRASRFYFRRDPADLSVEQIAQLVGMIKGPSTYDPRRNPQKCLERRAVVLDIMRDRRIIDAERYRQAIAEPLNSSTRVMQGGNRFPAFLDMVKRELQRHYREDDLNGNGMKILTTLDPSVQFQVEKQLELALQGLGKKGEDLEGAVVVTGSQSGEIQALAGGRNPRAAGFNRATSARRPIGSLVKPAVYLAALENGYTLASPLLDATVAVPTTAQKTWRPQNYDRREHGRVPLYLALANSYNLATVRLGMELGVGKVIDCSKKLGMVGSHPAYPSFLLGTAELTPIEVSQMYQTLASGGFYQPLRSIDSVLGADNRLLKRYGMEVEQRFSPASIFLLNAALQQTILEGTARPLAGMLPKGLTIAGKTGTTDNLRDSWFAGYTGDRLAVVWIGRDDNRPAGVTGASGAMLVWGRIFRAIPAQPLALPEPPGIQWQWVDRHSLQAASRFHDGAVHLPFIAGTAPEDHDALQQGIEAVEHSTMGLLNSLRNLFK